MVDRIGFPALVRPSYVLGGRAMEIVYDAGDLERAWGAIAAEGSLGREGGLSASRPVLIDRFLEDATEVDVDAIRDSTGEVLIGGVMEHVEEAGSTRVTRPASPLRWACPTRRWRCSRTTPVGSPPSSRSAG
ncbi:MAG: hypothetical protein R2716_03735 [Microthrixaceae bacterium]